MTSSKVAAVVLAAGEGKRLKSKLPKVLHPAAGKPLLVHALEAASVSGVGDVVAVVSVRRDEIADTVARFTTPPRYVVQDPPRGTGDAVKIALPAIPEAETVLVTNADLPLLSGETLRALMDLHKETGSAATMLTADAPSGSDFGRVIRTSSGEVERIVEARDATEEELQIDEVNVGVYVFDRELLSRTLGQVQSDNSQGEYYLTDVVGLLRASGHAVRPHKIEWEETLGVNDRVQLAEASKELYRRTAEHWMKEGVTIVDPSSTFIDSGVTLESDSTILPFTFLEGETKVGSGATVGPSSRIIDSVIDSGAEVSYSVVRGSHVGKNASVGPFASLRPGTEMKAGSKLGTFVETKKTTIGEGSKANHLAYLGDATIGKGVNVGAGTITCNWDGQNKHQTIIEDDAYISSDTMLVAPVRIGKRAATGAGSVVREDVPDDALAVGVPARIVEGKGNRLKKGH